MTAATKAFRTSKLEPKHATAFSVLTNTPQTLAAIAASLGTTTADAQKKLSLLIDESLAVQSKDAKGAPLSLYQLAS